MYLHVVNAGLLNNTIICGLILILTIWICGSKRSVKVKVLTIVVSTILVYVQLLYHIDITLGLVSKIITIGLHYSPTSNIKMVDLTLPLNSSTVFWPDSPGFNFTIIYREVRGPSWYEFNYFAMAEHSGTHLDSPCHFVKGKWRVHEIPVEKLIGPGVIINVTRKAEQDPDYKVQISDLEDWEAQYGRMPDNAVVLMKSGWSLKHPNSREVFNTKEVKNPATFRYPGWRNDTIEWLMFNRTVNIVGVDTPSVDYGQTTLFPVHQLLGYHNVPGLENVANLEKIPESGTTIFVGVIKLYDGSGGPARVMASYFSDGLSSVATSVTLNYACFLLLSCVVCRCLLKGV